MESPGFSKFRGLMDLYDDYLLEEEDQEHLKHFLDMQGLILFFKKDGDYFGAGEDSRVVFARLKNPDDENSKGWEDEASFTATNLSKMVNGEPSTNIFDKEDIKNIKIVDRDDMVKKLSEKASASGTRLGSVRIIKFSRHDPDHSDRDDAPNFGRTDEE